MFKAIIKEAEALYKDIQKKSDILLLDKNDKYFYATNHDDGNINTNYEFVPITGIRNQMTSSYGNMLSFDEMLAVVTYDNIKCKSCPFKSNLGINEFGCSLLSKPEIVSNTELVKKYVQKSCPLKIFRKANPYPKNFNDIMIKK